MNRYLKFVKPATEKYIEPSKIYTDIIIPNHEFEFDVKKHESMVMLIDLILNIQKQKEFHDGFKL